MDIMSIIIGILIAGGIGFWLGRKNSASEEELKSLKEALAAKQEELDGFRNKVNQHFEKTAELFNQVSDSYQSLYEHMAKSSGQLCASQTFGTLPKAQQSNDKPNTLETDANAGEQSESVFNPEKLYRAHEYRNRPPLKEPSHEESPNVVQLEKARESQVEQAEPALDYAIKDKGVINHNSLDIDGVKTS